ncbi:GGDEF domain-containing protein [Alcanivorax sp. JB21]|uniref:GGDEF domain-containing protein n=1 Tax=Alcanivorax limicola TaxID=2874102 RepID=UPI001CBAC2BA|nr:GGDEF domain-containing protein [Alcanivorax limicola]MBZ2189794.1 GGDEF domain-containing protein [Alcanivorax limicola]
MIRDMQEARNLALDDQRLARRHSLTAVAISALHAMVCMFYFRAGYFTLDGAGLAGLFALIWLGNLTLVAVVLTGSTRRMRDPSLSLYWNLWLTVGFLLSAYYMDEHRISVLMLFFAAMLLASFRQALPGLILLSVAAMGGYLLVVILAWQARSVSMNLTLELLQWLIFCMTAVSFVVTGVGINALRTNLTAKNRQLSGALVQVRDMAIRDELTGLFNRRHIMDVLAQQQALADSGDYYFTLCFVDLDHFKRINDTFGHTAGDQVLQRFAGIARRCLREADYTGRLGGEEFVLVLTQSDASSASRVAERLRQAVVEEDFSDLDPALRTSISIGIAQYRPGEPLDATLARADRCLYQAKLSGRDQVVTEAILAHPEKVLAPE